MRVHSIHNEPFCACSLEHFVCHHPARLISVGSLEGAVQDSFRGLRHLPVTAPHAVVHFLPPSIFLPTRFCDWSQVEEIIFKIKICHISPALSMNVLLVVALALSRALHRLDLTCGAQP